MIKVTSVASNYMHLFKHLLAIFKASNKSYYHIYDLNIWNKTKQFLERQK